MLGAGQALFGGVVALQTPFTMMPCAVMPQAALAAEVQIAPTGLLPLELPLLLLLALVLFCAVVTVVELLELPEVFPEPDPDEGGHAFAMLNSHTTSAVPTATTPPAIMAGAAAAAATPTATVVTTAATNEMSAPKSENPR